MDPREGRWREGSPMNKRRSGAAAVTLDNHVYVMGGWDGMHHSREAEVYEPRLDKWRVLAPMNDARR